MINNNFNKINVLNQQLPTEKIELNKTEVSIIDYSNTPKSWRVMLSSSLWNQKKYEEDFAVYPEVRRLAQSKGRCKMVLCPKLGDLVYFVMKGKIIMKGIVESDGFENGIYHQEHSCNIGGIRHHSIPTEFVWIKITEVGLSENIKPTGRRTWAKMPI